MVELWKAAEAAEGEDKPATEGLGNKLTVLLHCGRVLPKRSKTKNIKNSTNMYRTITKSHRLVITTVLKATWSTPVCCIYSARAPWDMWNREQKHGLKLYVQRVFIMDDAEQFMPTYYLRFVKVCLIPTIRH